jgi:predicted ABC-type ATPase
LEKIKAGGWVGFADVPEDRLRSIFIEAAGETFAETVAALNDGSHICSETVLSTPKYQTLIEQVQSKGGLFEMVYVALRSPSVSRERVSLRFEKGGHDVPTDKLADRWRRSLEYLPWFASRADHFWVIDNSDSTAGRLPLLVASGGKGKARLSCDESLVFPELLAAPRSAFPGLTP